MKYDFTTLHSRAGTHANKWDDMIKACPDVPPDIVPFSVADMEFLNAPEIAEGVSEYLGTHILGYTSPSAAYYQTVADWMERRHQWKVQPEWIIEYPGVIPGIVHALSCLTEPGDGVILLTPVYYPFYIAVNRTGRSLVECPLRPVNRHYEINFEDFEAKASDPKTKMVILCSPHNPVGRVWTREELVRLSDICLKNKVIMVCDEIHHDLILPGYKHTILGSIGEEVAQNSVICTAPTKTFNIAGMTIANLIVANPDWNKKMRDYKFSQFMFDGCIASYQACQTAYQRCEGWLEELYLVLDTNKHLVETFMQEKLPAVKVFDLEGTYLMWLDFSGLGMDYKEQERFLKQEAYWFVDDGYIFGDIGAGYERLNIACPTHILQAALDRLYHAWTKYSRKSV